MSKMSLELCFIPIFLLSLQMCYVSSLYAKQDITASNVANKETVETLQNAILSKFIEGNPTNSSTLNVENFQRIVLPYVLNELEISDFTNVEINVKAKQQIVRRIHLSSEKLEKFEEILFKLKKGSQSKWIGELEALLFELEYLPEQQLQGSYKSFEFIYADYTANNLKK